MTTANLLRGSHSFVMELLTDTRQTVQLPNMVVHSGIQLYSLTKWIASVNADHS